ncbi:hypothetical protein [Pareuzebyella sediminis]|uniref:hypothetical protein n=1 Tax=Pareuzebyella sediminis TaxID=2607998 RepID=UPI0011EE9805|nr:hypothetical protein [Pareuzebyella sediminis]
MIPTKKITLVTYNYGCLEADQLEAQLLEQRRRLAAIDTALISERETEMLLEICLQIREIKKELNMRIEAF